MPDRLLAAASRLRAIAHAWLPIPFALLFRIVPRRWRFDAARSAAHAVRPFVRPGGPLTPIHEHALWVVLDTLTMRGVRFDPAIEVRGRACLVGAMREGRGVLVVGVHAHLTRLVARTVDDLGNGPPVLIGGPELRIPGTARAADTLQPSPTLLVQVRRRWRDGRVVCALLDRPTGDSAATQRLQTTRGQLHVADQMIALATRCGVPVVFVLGALTRGGQVRLTLERSRSGVDGQSAAVAAELGRFIDAALSA